MCPLLQRFRTSMVVPPNHSLVAQVYSQNFYFWPKQSIFKIELVKRKQTRPHLSFWIKKSLFKELTNFADKGPSLVTSFLPCCLAKKYDLQNLLISAKIDGLTFSGRDLEFRLALLGFNFSKKPKPIAMAFRKKSGFQKQVVFAKTCAQSHTLAQKSGAWNPADFSKVVKAYSLSIGLKSGFANSVYFSEQL